MEKMQILFPKPQLDRLRRIAGARDRPVSELVRAAVDAWLERQGHTGDQVREAPPVFHCGEINAPARDLREAAYHDRASV